MEIIHRVDDWVASIRRDGEWEQWMRGAFQQDEARDGVVNMGFREKLQRIEIHLKCLPVTFHHRWLAVPSI
jgi:hypothetical protein